MTQAGVLCIPFPRLEAEDSRNNHVLEIEQWLIGAAAEAGVHLAPIRGNYNSDSEVIVRIYEAIEAADIVIGVVHEVNPNVFYECGFAIGRDKPVLYVAHKDDSIPFDISGVERFTYSEMTTETARGLTEAIRACLDSARNRARLADPLSRAVRHFERQNVGGQRLFALSLKFVLSETGNWLTSMTSQSFEVSGAASILDAGTHILRNLGDKGFATQYFSGQASWQGFASKGTQDDYFLATRQAVERGRKIIRVYVLDDEAQIDAAAFRETALADISAGVDARYILAADLPHERARDFGLWDGELRADIDYFASADASPSLQRCVYRCDAASLHEAERWRDHILLRAKPCPDLPSERELLELSAFSLPERATAHCGKTSGRKENCTDYHLPWQRLRLCGMVSTPGWHSAFYTDAVARWAESLRAHRRPDEPVRLLITGLADYGMLYWLVQSLPSDLRTVAEIHVLDICRTPLDSCLWLSLNLERRMSPALKMNVEVHHEDLFGCTLESSFFDLIVSDAFLTRFDGQDEKVAVTKEWLRLARPGGRILTTARVRSGVDDIDDSHRSAFVLKAVQRAQQMGLDQDDIAAAANAYADYITSHPFPNVAAVRDFLNRFSDLANFDDPAPTLISEQEMVVAHYARLEIRRN
jgi:hypothetical protein